MSQLLLLGFMIYVNKLTTNIVRTQSRAIIKLSIELSRQEAAIKRCAGIGRGAEDQKIAKNSGGNE